MDPDIRWYKSLEYPYGKENFGIFLDSMPDTWGRTLMRRRAAMIAMEQGKPTPVLHETDYLLGVHNLSRMGALPLKTSPESHFLDDNPHTSTPPWASIQELPTSPDLRHGVAGTIEK